MELKRDGERWAVVGGGLLGMTLALRLAQAGRRVVLFEGARHLGGLAAPWRLGDVVWDRHYHVTLLSDLRLRGLLRELGFEPEMRWARSRSGFYTDGQLHPFSSSLDFLRFPPLGLLDKARLAATILRASRIRDGRKLEGLTAVEWLRRWSGRRTVERIWLPLLRAKLGESWRHASASFIWATIARLYAARSAGLKREMFGWVPGGYARVIDRLTEHLRREGVSVLTGHLVTRAGPWQGQVGLEFENGLRDGFDRVVMTLPAPAAAKVCHGLEPDERRRLQEVRYLGIICASLLLRRPLTPYYVTNITDPGFPFTGVIEMSALVDRSQFQGKNLVYLPRYLAPEDPAFAESDAAIEERFLAGLARMHPRLERRDVLCCRISRVKHVFALSTVGRSGRMPPRDTSIPGLHLVSSAHIVNGTLNVNETVGLAEDAARDLLAARAPAACGAAR